MTSYKRAPTSLFVNRIHFLVIMCFEILTPFQNYCHFICFCFVLFFLIDECGFFSALMFAWKIQFQHTLSQYTVCWTDAKLWTNLLKNLCPKHTKGQWIYLSNRGLLNGDVRQKINGGWKVDTVWYETWHGFIRSWSKNALRMKLCACTEHTAKWCE